MTDSQLIARFDRLRCMIADRRVKLRRMKPGNSQDDATRYLTGLQRDFEYVQSLLRDRGIIRSV